MWLYRIITTEGDVCHALDRTGDCMLERVEGSFPDTLRATGEPVVAAAVLAPVDPPAIFGIGLNYRAYARQIGKEPGPQPLVFMKQPGAVTGHEGLIRLPTRIPARNVDYEGEIAVVIGRACLNVDVADALGYVAGYTCANDVSARDWQFELGGGQFSRAKSFDTFCPLGPCLRLSGWMASGCGAAEAIEPDTLQLETFVNGELRQQGTTADLIFGIAELIRFLSADTCLQPGTVILTGTPGGTGSGQHPPAFLAAGDVIEVRCPQIGTLRNTVGG